MAFLIVCVLGAVVARADAAPAGGVAGHVMFVDPASGLRVPVGGAVVQICPVPAGTPCTIVHTTADGFYIVNNLPAGDYTITAFAIAGMNASPVRRGPIPIRDGAVLDGQDLVLQLPTTFPPGATLTPSRTDGQGVPTIYWGDAFDFSMPACAGGTGTWRITQNGVTVNSGALTEGPTGTYRAAIPALYPAHGDASFEWQIDCPGTVPDVGGSASLYIDPSGFVRTVTLEPIAGAKVVLQRSDTPTGPFTAVPDGDPIMAPHNRRNPDTTRPDGGFGWDVIAGYYKVIVSKQGCVDPFDPNKDFVETKVMTIPPAVMDLDLRLRCPGHSVSTDHKVLGTVPDALSLTLSAPSSSFGTFVPGVAKTYDASVVANVISSYDDTTLTVSDPSGASAGHLVNGTFALPAPLQVRVGQQFQALGSSLSLGGWSEPVANATTPIQFRQSIAATDALRRGEYSKTLTFTLSTNSP